MTTTPILGIPYIASSQSQPEVTHNTALNMIQLLTYGARDKDLTAPPGSPIEGDVYIVGSLTPTGAWAGRANSVAGFFGGAWIFLPDRDNNGSVISMGLSQAGLLKYVVDEDLVYVWNGAAWTSTGAGPIISG